MSQNLMGVDDSNIELQLPSWCAEDNMTVPFTIMRDFLVSSKSENIHLAAADAAANLTRNLPAGSYTMDEYLQSASIYVMGVFGTILNIAEQMAADHPHHHYRLAALVSALKDQPQPEPDIGDKICSQYPFRCSEFRWEELPSFSFQHSALFRYKSRFEPWTTRNGFTDCWTPTQWRNLNAFISVLVAENAVEKHLWFPETGLIVLWHTLEFHRSAYDLEDNIPVAATWILTAGSWMREHREMELQIPWVALEDDVQYYDGPQIGFNDERWQFWKSKFQDLTTRNDLTAEAKTWAQNAADHMDSLDLESTSIEDRVDL